MVNSPRYLSKNTLYCLLLRDSRESRLSARSLKMFPVSQSKSFSQREGQLHYPLFSIIFSNGIVKKHFRLCPARIAQNPGRDSSVATMLGTNCSECKIVKQVHRDDQKINPL